MFCSISASYATHIVGGSLTYIHLGGSSYKVVLKLYRDCDPSSVDFPGSTLIEVRGSDTTNLNLDFRMFMNGRDTLQPHIDTCAVNPNICVEEAIYSKIVSLPPNLVGYHLIYQLCCRNYSIDNITNPGNYGETFHTYIPNNNVLLTNSSPVFANFPPVFVCATQDVDFDHSATDPDGDSLVYSLYTPYDGVEWETVPQSLHWDYFPSIGPPVAPGTPPDNITFPTVVWEPGFDENNALNGGVGPLADLSIDQAGHLTGFPANAGQFVVGVKVEEYRDGVKIGTVVRDFQFNVIVCPPAKDAGITPVLGCDETDIQMINGSAPGANDFTWDFDPANPGTVTSNATNPSYDFGGIGNYPIMLIAQSGTACADTAFYTVPISNVVADFSVIDSACVEEPINFTDNSTSSANGTINSWLYNFGDTETSVIPNTSHAYNSGALYTVEFIAGNDIGCYDTIEKDVYIQSFPEVLLGVDTSACLDNPVVDLTGIVNNADGGFWVGSGGDFLPRPDTLSITYVPGQPELDLGESTLILTSTGNGHCPTRTDTIRIEYIEKPIIDAGEDQSVCKDTASVQLEATVQFGNGVAWFTNEGTGSFNDTTLINPLYYPSTADTAAGSILIYVQTNQDASCAPSLDSLVLNFFDPPTMMITGLDTICADLDIDLNSNTSTLNGFWETLGDGSFAPMDTSVTTTYSHGIQDSLDGFVDIVYHTLDNGGCQVVLDTHRIEILAAPTASFSATLECQNVATEFTDGTVFSDPIDTWDWTFEPGGSSSDQNPNYIFTTDGDHTVELVVTTDNGCTDTAVNVVTVHSLPDAAFNPVTACLEGGTQFIDSTTLNNASIVSWDWTFSDGGNDTVQDPLYFFPSAGSYDVELVVMSEYGCLDSITQTYSILPGPTAEFTFDPSSAYVFQNVHFTDQSQGDNIISDWDWNFGDATGTSFIQNPDYNYGEGGTYTITLIIEDESGCVDTTYKDINIYLPPLVPNAFSPNNDGSNDILFVHGGPFIELTFKVYNNWGEVIFVSTNQSDGWDGTYKGADQPVGNYVYTVVAKTEDGKEHTLSGDVQILR
jgi:gliding motility-associated-like protein